MDADDPMQGLPEIFDLISYTGKINRTGYEALCQQLKERRRASAALLVLATPGGDANAGFRIARALSHAYEYFYALVPRYCKSAGTLILLGAKRLYLDDMSELGPLDVQVKKGDELVGRNSGLEFLKAVDYLQAQTMTSFRNCLVQLTQVEGLSTRVASDIAAKLTSGLLEPIAGQIDPLKLAEMQRATEIAYEYGFRLAEASGNIRPKGLQALVAGYPSHGFVIDRKEAKKIFIDIRRPEGLLAALSEAFRLSMNDDIDSPQPKITIQFVGPEEVQHGQDSGNAGGPAAGASRVEPPNDGNSAAAQRSGEGVAEPSEPPEPVVDRALAANDAKPGSESSAGASNV